LFLFFFFIQRDLRSSQCRSFFQDDKASLERLHDLIHGEGHEHQLQPFTRQEDSIVDEPPTPKAERRRSLPTRTSMTSLYSEFSISTNMASPDPQETTFQTRRRRAAKLTQFFGVDYRDLMSEVLDSLEKGLEEEGGRGTLKPDEVQVSSAFILRERVGLILYRNLPSS
jgi:hypothetical protein